MFTSNTACLAYLRSSETSEPVALLSRETRKTASLDPICLEERSTVDLFPGKKSSAQEKGSPIKVASALHSVRD
jgi:hypothetical protein